MSFRAFGALIAACLGLTCVAGETRASQGIDFPAFSSTAGLALNGAASVTGGRLRLCPAAGDEWVSGSAWHSDRVYVAGGFTTTFAFQLTEQDDYLGGGDGFAFVIQNSGADAVGTAGRGLGYGGGDGGEGGIPNSLAIEFDTYQNADDPDDNHVSVHTRGTAPNSDEEQYSIGRTSAIPPLKDGAVHTGRVEYVGGLLSVYVDDLENPALAVAADLGSLQLDAGKAYVGFTSSVATARENHDLLSWSVSTDVTLPAPTNLTAVATSATMVNLQWQVNSNGETGIEVQRRTGDGAFESLALAGPNSSNYSDTSVLPGTVYTYRVRAIYGEARSDFSNEANTRTAELAPVVTAAKLGLPEMRYDGARDSLELRIPLYLKGRGSGVVSGRVLRESGVPTPFDADVTLSVSDWTYARDLRVALLIGPAQYEVQCEFPTATPVRTGTVSGRVTGFVPTKHGFRFANTAQIRPRSLPGLCLGMSRVAHDYFMRSKPVPTSTSPSAKLRNALANSHRLGTARVTAVDFPRVLAHTSDGAAIRTEVERIQGGLATGEPQVAVLQIDRSLSLQAGHAVLVLASFRCTDVMIAGAPGQEAVRLSAYDPNYPGVYRYLDVVGSAGNASLTYDVSGTPMHILMQY